MTQQNKLPVRRGVVMRATGIEDSYGTPYVRDEGTGQLFRVGPKVRPKHARTQSASMHNQSNVVAQEGDHANGADARVDE